MIMGAGPKYLIRFDDVCPTMNWSIWHKLEEMLYAFKVKPILAVIPDNKDEKLMVAAANHRFWETVRQWQADGWTIGLHGYQHVHLTSDSGVLKMARWSEFSGLSRSAQHTRLQSALEICKHNAVVPGIWVAPAHSFDGETLSCLYDLGIRCLSDGFAVYPHQDASGMLWIPQQLWRFRKMPLGVWTVCLHINRWTPEDVSRFYSDLEKFAPFITDVSTVVETYRKRERTAADVFFSGTCRLAVKGRRWARQLLLPEPL